MNSNLRFWEVNEGCLSDELLPKELLKIALLSIVGGAVMIWECFGGEIAGEFL